MAVKTDTVLHEPVTKTAKRGDKESFISMLADADGKVLSVYADTKKMLKVGEVFATTRCKVFDKQGDMVCIRYVVNSTGAYKVGWIDCSGKEVH